MITIKNPCQCKKTLENLICKISSFKINKSPPKLYHQSFSFFMSFRTPVIMALQESKIWMVKRNFISSFYSENIKNNKVAKHKYSAWKIVHYFIFRCSKNLVKHAHIYTHLYLSLYKDSFAADATGHSYTGTWTFNCGFQGRQSLPNCKCGGTKTFLHLYPFPFGKKTDLNLYPIYNRIKIKVSFFPHM